MQMGITAVQAAKMPAIMSQVPPSLPTFEPDSVITPTPAGPRTQLSAVSENAAFVAIVVSNLNHQLGLPIG